MAANKIHDPQICPNLHLKAFMTHLIQVIVSEGFDRGSRLNSSLACQLLQNFSLQILAFLPTLKHFITQMHHHGFDLIGPCQVHLTL